MIIGLSGHIKSGKSTAATIIKQLNPSFTEKYFAYKLKLIASIITGDDIELFETQAGKDGFLPDWGMTRRNMLQQIGTESLRNHFEQLIWVKSLFADYKLQFGGYGMSDHDLTQVYPNWIISDVRFENEAEEIKKRGGLLVRVNRPFSLIYPEMWTNYIQHTFKRSLDDIKMDNLIASEISEIDFVRWLSNGDQEQQELFNKVTHSSEVGLDNYNKFDLVINNVNSFEVFKNEISTFMQLHNVAQ